MKKKVPVVEIRQLKAGRLHGFHAETTAQEMRKAIPELSTRDHKALEKTVRSVLPLYVITRDYDPASGRQILFFGGEVPHDALEVLEMPGAPYARVLVKPKFSVFWAPAIAAAKKWFYEEWLPASGYESLNIEFELHSERSMEKNPVLELFFALRRKES